VKYFQFELYTSESQDCSIQKSQRLVSKNLLIEEQVQVEKKEKQEKVKREKQEKQKEKNIIRYI